MRNRYPFGHTTQLKEEKRIETERKKKEEEERYKEQRQIVKDIHYIAGVVLLITCVVLLIIIGISSLKVYNDYTTVPLKWTNRSLK